MVSGGLRRMLLLLGNEAKEVKEEENELEAKKGRFGAFSPAHVRLV